MVEKVKKVKVKDLETSTTKWGKKVKYDWKDLPEGFLSKTKIPTEYYNKDVYIAINRTKTKANSELFKLMNGRFVLKQLDLNLQATDRRETYYSIRKAMNGKLDSGINIKSYCKKLEKHLGYKYWAYVYDYLNIKPAETVIIYDTEMNTTTLSNKNLKDYAKTPFFLIICEKEEPLRATMEEMIKRGYTEGFYGVSTGGTSTSYNIKLLIELSETRNFYAFIMTDLDLNGIVIFLDMLKWFPCESIGINPEMLASVGVKFEEGNEEYKPENKDNTIKGLRKTIKELDISKEQREIYRNWIRVCLNKRFELNSLTSLRLDENINISKARDFEVIYLTSYLFGYFADC